MALINRVRVIWTGVPGSPAYTNFYADNGAASVSAFHAAVSSYISSVRAYVTTGCTATVEGDVALVDTALDQVIGVTTVSSVTWVGTASGAALPPSSQLVVRWLTSTYLNGRQVRGRWYIPYLGSGASSSGVVATAAITAVNTATSAYLTTLSGAARVYSPTNGVAVAIVTGNTWNQFGVMRSRRD